MRGGRAGAPPRVPMTGQAWQRPRPRARPPRRSPL